MAINANGTIGKEGEIFHLLLQNQCDIGLISEIHKTTEFFKNQAEMTNYAVFENPTHLTSWNGTAITIKKELVNQNNTTHTTIENGRINKIEIKIKEKMYHIYCVYLQSESDSAQSMATKVTTIRNLKTHILSSKRSNARIVVGGDFNLILDRKDTVNPTYFRNSPDVKEFQTIINETSMIDAFRKLNPQEKKFTRIEGNSATRIDRIYLSENLAQLSPLHTFIPTPFSDHIFSPSVIIRKKRPLKWGRGTWKLNESLMTQNNFNILKQKWENHQKTKVCYPNILEWWDAGKKKIRKTFIELGIQNRRQQMQTTSQLADELQKIHTLTHLSTEQKRRKIAEIKFKLKQINSYKTKGQIIRSRVTQINNEQENSTDFFKIENRNKNKKQIKTILKGDEEITGKEHVLEEVHNFWNELWGKKKEINQEQQIRYINENIENPEEDTENHTSFEITLMDIRTALDKQNKKGSPGSDGLGANFYLWAWRFMAEDLHEVINNAYLRGEMSDSQKTAVVTIIPKTGDTRSLKNWRPISLLNIDYKIIARVVTKRILEDLEGKISNEQKCAIEGRQMHDIHLNIHAILKRLKQTNNKAILTCYDYTKAFDMIDHSIIFNTLKRLGVKLETIRWVQTLYNNIISKIQVNGALTREIIIMRGIRQGCPLSMLLFVIALEAMYRKIKANNDIIAPHDNLKNQGYADDLKTITADSLSQQFAQKEVETFCNLSGLELNNSKTNIMTINLTQLEIDDLQRKNQQATISNELKILGIIFNNSTLISKNNWKNKIKAIDNTLKNHWNRDLTLFGKVKIINALALSHIIFISKLLLPSRDEIKQINSIIFKFLWAPRKIEQCARAKIIKHCKDGGLGIPDIKSRAEAVFLSRAAGILGSEPHELTETWQKDARYQIGTRMRSINENLYTNLLPNADQPDQDYRKILELYNKINFEGLVWKNIKVKTIFHYLNINSNQTDLWERRTLKSRPTKHFFSNIEREIAWRTLNGAYKWTTFLETINNETSFCFLCNQRGRDTAEHLFSECTITREIWIGVNNYVNSICTRAFPFDPRLIKENIPPQEESQESWLIPLKATNITKAILLNHRQRQYMSGNPVADTRDWAARTTAEITEDLDIFLRNLKNNTNEISKYSLPNQRE